MKNRTDNAEFTDVIGEEFYFANGSLRVQSYDALFSMVLVYPPSIVLFEEDVKDFIVWMIKQSGIPVEEVVRSFRSTDTKSRTCDFCEKPCGNAWCPTLKDGI